MKTTKAERVAEIKATIENLQMWFAAKPYGWREQASEGQLQQWADREREQDSLIESLGRLAS